MDRLVEDLIDVVSLDAGKLALAPARHDAVALLGEAIASCAHAAAEHDISIRCETVATTLLATFDRERMLQVLGNLLTNALKFTPRRGAIVLRSDRVEGELRISVRDTGAGIPESMLAAVFERFTQVADHDRRGLGLGLYISRCIVESHGGRMWVESTLGQGSTFYFTIPDVMTRTQDIPAVPTPGLARKARVLIVDDDRDMGETLALCLNRKGFAATSRSSPREALALIQANEFDAIVTDLNMDEMNGLALCERIVQLRPGLPVIVTTGFGASDAKAAAIVAGAFDFLTKPIDVDVLRLTLNRALLGLARSDERLARSD